VRSAIRRNGPWNPSCARSLLAPAAARRLSAGLPHCRTEAVAGPHLLLQAAPEACADRVAAFALGLDAGVAITP